MRRLEGDTVLIEGNAEALEFLGNLLIAQARFSKDCGFEISPHGPGSAVFSPEASVGVYIHRLPCPTHQGAGQQYAANFGSGRVTVGGTCLSNVLVPKLAP